MEAFTTGNIFLDFLIVGFIGVIVHTLLKGLSLQRDASATKVKFDFMDYVKKDWIVIALSFLAVILWLFIFDEAIKKAAWIGTFIKTSFGVMGAAGSYALQQGLGKSKKWIRAQMSDKSAKAQELDDMKDQ